MKAVDATSARVRAPDVASRTAVVDDPGGLDPGKQWRARRGIPVVPAFDGYRALAIAGVVLFHLAHVSGVFAAAGGSALGTVLWGILPRTLDALFLVSGFVMFLPVAVRGGEFGRVSVFAVRRAARLVPAYWVCLGISVVLLATVSDSPGPPSWGSVLSHLAIVQTPVQLFEDGVALGFGVIPPVWTLSVEVAFYVVLPLVAGWWYRRPWAGLVAAAPLFIAWREFALHVGDLANVVGIELSASVQERFATYYGSQFPTWGMALGAGMTVAWLYVKLRDRVAPDELARRAAWATLGLGLLLALFVYLAGREAVDDPDPFAGLFAGQSTFVGLGYPLVLGGFLLALALSPRWLQLPVSNGPVRWAADISYGVYLIHFAVVFFAIHEFNLPNHGRASDLLLWSALVYPVSIGYAYLSAKFLERPVRAWAHRYGRRRQAKDRAHALA
jgi:peptidoglycan/LPS O-acetylase OafA/YrhL